MLVFAFRSFVTLVMHDLRMHRFPPTLTVPVAWSRIPANARSCRRTGEGPTESSRMQSEQESHYGPHFPGFHRFALSLPAALGSFAEALELPLPSFRVTPDSSVCFSRRAAKWHRSC